ncbi:hypothetical protein GGTG_10407 [Gaeumannomyces tritici R3-111a-1]|uniref:Uncharacterized protein n=1 Tax=Gaeumannomyces tritici (strain R3-111a-1) TaxID=644352 RepID=J3PA81_GAET3|nr:hypothetical protein GGTG_10407 [Gaeumannomyces tritici R3-111a-1]EJT71147.1 hypothetical protein GGTG_10407 [Gaeumannomyces tritici R3-111a-1]
MEAGEGDDDPDSVDLENIQVSMEFLWTIEFEFDDSRVLDDWRSGVLIDLSDVIFPFGYGRDRRRYYPGDAKCLREQGGVYGNPQRP